MVKKNNEWPRPEVEFGRIHAQRDSGDTQRADVRLSSSVQFLSELDANEFARPLPDPTSINVNPVTSMASPLNASSNSSGLTARY
jgi:hypothetical protein